MIRHDVRREPTQLGRSLARPARARGCSLRPSCSPAAVRRGSRRRPPSRRSRVASRPRRRSPHDCRRRRTVAEPDHDGALHRAARADHGPADGQPPATAPPDPAESAPPTSAPKPEGDEPCLRRRRPRRRVDRRRPERDGDHRRRRRDGAEPVRVGDLRQRDLAAADPRRRRRVGGRARRRPAGPPGCVRRACRRHHGEPTEVTDRFRIASISKTITAIVIMQMVERGELSLDQPVGQILLDHLGVAPTDPGRAQPDGAPAAQPHVGVPEVPVGVLRQRRGVVRRRRPDRDVRSGVAGAWSRSRTAT